MMPGGGSENERLCRSYPRIERPEVVVKLTQVILGAEMSASSTWSVRQLRKIYEFRCLPAFFQKGLDQPVHIANFYRAAAET